MKQYIIPEYNLKALKEAKEELLKIINKYCSSQTRTMIDCKVIAPMHVFLEQYYEEAKMRQIHDCNCKN